MIILNRDEAQQVLDALINAKGYIFYNVLDDKGNRYDAAADILRAKLHEYPRNQVTPHEFVAAATGKEDLIGMPIIWAEWPMREER